MFIKSILRFSLLCMQTSLLLAMEYNGPVHSEVSSKVSYEIEQKQPTAQISSLVNLCLDTLSNVLMNNSDSTKEFDSETIAAISQTQLHAFLHKLILRNRIIHEIPLKTKVKWKGDCLLFKDKGNYVECSKDQNQYTYLDTAGFKEYKNVVLGKDEDSTCLSPQLNYKIKTRNSTLSITNLNTGQSYKAENLESNHIEPRKWIVSRNEKFLVVFGKHKNGKNKNSYWAESIIINNLADGKALVEFEHTANKCDIHIKDIDNFGNVTYLKRQNGNVYCTFYQVNKKITTDVQLQGGSTFLGYEGDGVFQYENRTNILTDTAVSIINEHMLFVYSKYSNVGYLITFKDNDISTQVITAPSAIIGCEPNPFNTQLFAIVVQGSSLGEEIDKYVDIEWIVLSTNHFPVAKIIRPKFAKENSEYKILPSFIIKDDTLHSVYVVDCSKDTANSICVYKNNFSGGIHFISKPLCWLANNNLRLFSVKPERIVNQKRIEERTLLYATTINIADLLKYSNEANPL